MPILNFINQTNDPPEAGSVQSYFPDGNDAQIMESLLGDNNEWVSARAALRNSDLFSIILQLSSDLAIVKINAEKKRIKESLIIQVLMLINMGFGNQCLHSCF